MIVDISKQVDLFLISLYFGVFTALFFDIFRVVRKVFRHNNLTVQLEDFVFWIITTFSFYYIFLHQNNGEIRLFIIFGALIGFVLFNLTISMYFIKYLTLLAKLIKKIISKIFNLLLQPLTFLCKIVVRKKNNFTNTISKNKILFQKLKKHSFFCKIKK